LKLKNTFLCELLVKKNTGQLDLESAFASVGAMAAWLASKLKVS